MKSPIALFACVVAILAASMPLMAQSPNPNEPYIQSISYGGTGCPQGSVGSSFANDRKSFTLIFDSFLASSGPGVPVTENRKNCQVNLNVHLPQGTGRFCTAFDYRGYVQLPSGVTAEAKRTYYFQGEVEQRSPDPQVFDGPVSKDYLGRDNEIWNYEVESPDGAVKPLNINGQVRLLGPAAAQAQITNDSIDGAIVPCAVEDTTAPTITVSTPVLYGLYGLGASVTPVFACTDEDGGSGVASCTSPAALDTSSVGPKTFTVTAVDNAGNTSTTSVTYAVGGKEECKGGGHGKFLVPTFKNQGLCVSSYVGKK